MPEARRAEYIGQASNSGKCIGFVLFHEQKYMQIYQPNSYTTETQNHMRMFVTYYK